jgi:glycosyltransferase involved in cell wall biosynthesis
VSQPLSVVIAVCNEARNLQRCLDSVAWADEVAVLVDSRSGDETEEIARKFGAKVSVHPYEGDIEQKQFAVAQATHDWVLLVDGDEVVTERLAAELRSVLANETDRFAGYEVNRITYHLGRWIRHGDFYPDWVLRAFRRSKYRYVGRNPHGRITVDGETRRLSGHIQHYSYPDLAGQITRIQQFTDQAALAMQRDGRRFRLWDLLVHPPARFVRSYLIKAGFLEGMPGFIIAVAGSFYSFLKYAKLWEMQRVPPSRGNAENSGDGASNRAE